jgi:biopolymer transport protein ExbD
MKFISENKSSFSIEITPLIDIVFLLVIFFVVTSKVGDSQFLSLELPKTESFKYKTVQNSNEIVIINNGSIYINDKVFDIDNVNDLEQAIFELENNGDALILSAESDSLHVWVVTVMDLLNKYGFNEVQIRTIEK